MAKKQINNDLFIAFKQQQNVPAPQPCRIHYWQNQRRLEVIYFKDQVDDYLTTDLLRKNEHFVSFKIATEILRVFSPPTTNYASTAFAYQVIGGKFRLAILDIQSIGRYAIRIKFADQYSAGIYHWSWLFELARHQLHWWKFYLTCLRQAQLTRYPNSLANQVN